MQKMIQYIDTQTSFTQKNVSDLIVYNCGTENCDPNYFFGPISREFNLIHFVLKGCGKLVIDNETYPVHEKQAFLIPANKVAFYQADSKNPWEYCWVGFMGFKSDYYLQNIASVSKKEYVINLEDVDYFYNSIKEMLMKSGSNLSSYLILQGYLHHILAKLVTDNESRILNTPYHLSYTLQAINFIDKNYSNNLQINAIAQYLGLHPNYLSTIFKQETGVTPKEYLIKLRIKKACELLEQTNYSINVISNCVGYSDQLTFSRAFKTVTGKSPKTYRKNPSS
jgi:AraC-like DNA-binding protein